MGQSPPSEHYNQDRRGIAFFQGKADFGERNPTPRYWCTQPTKIAEAGDVLISVRAPVGPTNLADQRCCIGRGLAALRPTGVIDREFMLLGLKAFERDLAALGFGTTFVAINKRQLSTFLFPLPPLAEQHCTVAKVDELMALCDRLEAAREAREARRDRLTAASLARLNAPNPETFADDARFALDVLPSLTARPDQINALRQTILNLAVRGKLLPQDPSEEPASELLRRIAKEKARLVKERKAKRQDLLPEPDLDQVPFELPVGWAWGRFPELGTFGRGKSKHRPRNDPALFLGGEHLMIQTGDVARAQGLIETYTNKYNEFGLSQSFKWPKGTLCITIAANIADSGILGFDACFPDSVVGFVPASMFENARYFEYFVRTAKANLVEFAPATAQKNINLEILTQVLIPLPPLAEQSRIVAKVDELMALCDKLEAGLSSAAEIRGRLLDALFAEALAPANVGVREAAE
jgi:type I restriction enzyme S subunit